MGTSKAKARPKKVKKPASGKLCCRGLCKCRQRVGKAGARLSAKMPRREAQLAVLFGPSRDMWPAELLLPAGTGPGKLGNVRIAWGHFQEDELKITTQGGKGAPPRAPAPSPRPRRA